MPGPPDDPAARQSAIAGRDARLPGWLSAAFQRPTVSVRARRILLLLAGVLFVALAVVSFRSLPDDAHLEWWPAVSILLTSPLMALVNAAEFKVIASLSGQPVAWIRALRIAVISTAANLLPLPGGIVIRTQTLKAAGSSYGRALTANAAAGLAWVGTGCFAIGALFTASAEHRVVSPAFLGGGVAAVGALAWIVRRMQRAWSVSVVLQFLAVESATVAVSAVRIYLAFHIVGLSVSAGQAVALTAAQIIAAAIGFFPAGLGLRELIAGGIASAVGVAVSAAVASTVVDRLFGQIGLSVMAMALVVPRARSSKYDRSEGREAGAGLTPLPNADEHDGRRGLEDPGARA